LYKRVSALLFAVLVAAAVLAGCGGGSDSTSGGGTESDTSSSGPAPTKAVFIKEADKICEKADGELNEEVTEYAEENNIPTGKEPTEDQTIEIYEAVVLPNVSGQAEGIAQLTPPEGDEDTVEGIVSSLEEGVSEAEEDPQQLVEGKNPLEDASKKATAYGMKVCGAEG
jgi:predicted small secreted protein